MPVGTIVEGRYRIDAVLGGGGMATVYRAHHLRLEQPVALKIVAPQVRAIPGVVQRFLREARAATALKGEHVVRVFDVGTTDGGAPYMVMELLEGTDLSELVAARGPLPVEEAIDYVLQACEALAEVHGVGIVHRDLKPANLFVARAADGSPLVKLIDFGISRVEAALTTSEVSKITQPEEVMGSPRYMSPEQLESAAKADTRSDIWALGAVLYELLTGDAPYDGESMMDIYAAARREAVKPPSEHRPDVPPALDAIVLRCLRSEPDERYPDVAELAAALAACGAEGASLRADAIQRVLDATRARTGGDSDAHEALPLHASRVRRKVPSRWRNEAVQRRFASGLGLAAIAAAVVSFAARSALHPATVSPAAAAQPVVTVTAAAPPSPPPPAPVETTVTTTAAVTAPAAETNPSAAVTPTSATATEGGPKSPPPVASPPPSATVRPPPPRAPVRAARPSVPPPSATPTPAPAASPAPTSTDSLFEERQ